MPSMTPSRRSDLLSAQYVDLLLRKVAESLSIIRKMKRLLEEHQYRVEHLREWDSSDYEQLEDWQNACSFLMLMILDESELEFTHLDAASFCHVEGVWLSDVKRLKAYYLWERAKTGTPDENYFQACQAIRHALCHKERAPLEEFEKVQAYLESEYLEDGKITEAKPATKALIRRKAFRIWENTGDPDQAANWCRAKSHVRLFYENIIPAVVEDHEAAMQAVLKAFQFGKAAGAPYHITTGFEAALAIEFLDKAMLRRLLGRPQAYAYSMVPVVDWPKGQGLSTNGLRYCPEERQIVYHGIMKEQQKQELLQTLREERHKIALQRLYEQCCLPSYEETLL